MNMSSSKIPVLAPIQKLSLNPASELTQKLVLVLKKTPINPMTIWIPMQAATASAVRYSLNSCPMEMAKQMQRIPEMVFSRKDKTVRLKPVKCSATNDRRVES